MVGTTDRSPKSTRWLAMMLTAAVAMLAGFALAIAPVTQPEVTVTWPQDGQEVKSTALLLANQTPHRLELELNGAAVRSASNSGGTVFATMRPDRVGVDESAGDIGIPGLLVTVSGDQLSWATGFERLDAVWSMEDVWTLTSSVEGMTIERDGVVAAQWDATLPPQIDALITDARGLDAAALKASVQAVDDASTESTAVKWIILVVALGGFVASAVLIGRDDRKRMAPAADAPRQRRDWRLGVIDGAVVTALVVWTFIGSMTADDGYYATMSLNNDEAGFVGNYFQMFNQPFAPFVWFWQLLDLWQQVGGSSAVWLRIPSLLAAVAAWFIVRAFVRSYVRLKGALRIVLIALAGVVFVAWWSAFNIGTRPESVASLATILAVLLISRSIERSRLLPAFLAVAVASLAFTAHPTGVVAFAPLLLSVPALWRIASSGGASLSAAFARTAGVASGGVAALIAAFHDASLYDGLSSQRRFAAVETPRTWIDELARYNFLLEWGPQGAYIKRLLVLVALVLVVWFVAAWVWDRRAQQRRIITPVALLGWSFALGFVLIWITTSKWSHHFGAMASVGGLFVAVAVVLLPKLLAETLSRGARVWTSLLGVVTLAPPIALAFSGPNYWYSWNAGLPQSGVAPHLGPVGFGNLAAWVIGGLIVLACLYMLRVRRAKSDGSALLAAPAIVVIGAMVLGTGYMFATFAWATARMLPTFSTAAANVIDPLGASCLSSKAVSTWDASGGVPLQSLGDGDDAYGERFLPRGLDTSTVSSSGASVWSTTDGSSNRAISVDAGEYAWPELTDGERVVIAAGGRVAEAAPTRIEVVYRDEEGFAIGQPVRIQDVTDWEGWRTFDVPSPADPAVSFSVVISSTSTAQDDWVAVTTPSIAERGTLLEDVPAGAAVSSHWMTTFWFPCERPPAISDGIIEPPAAYTSVDAGGGDLNPWRVQRGGIIAGVQRLGDVMTTEDDMLGFGPDWGNVHLVDYPVAMDAYDVSVERVVTPGWRSAFPEPSQLIVVERAG